MSVGTVGIINKQIDIEEVVEFLKEKKNIKNVNYNKNFSYLDNCCYYSVNFNYSNGFCKCEKRTLDVHIYNNSSESIGELKEKYPNREIDLSKFNNGYTYLNLNSWGKSPWLIFSLLNHFKGGYFIPNDYSNNIYYIDKNTNQENFNLNDVAYF